MTRKAYRIATKVAGTSTCPIAQMAAVVTKGGKVLSAASNGVGRGRGWGKDHCEVRALRAHVDYEGADILVVRLNGRGTSKPCPACWAKLVVAGINRVTYTAYDGTLVTERV